MDDKKLSLRPGDAFTMRETLDTFSVSFIDSITNDQRYRIHSEILIQTNKATIFFYDFSKSPRVYYFPEPHKMTNKEERELIKKLFVYEVKSIDKAF